MNNTSMIISVFCVVSIFTMHCQEARDQRIQELEKALIQKAEELSDLGQQIGNKYELLKSMALKSSEYVQDLCDGHDEKEQETIKQTLSASVANFNEKFMHAYNEKVDIKGLIVKECIDTELSKFGVNFAYIMYLRCVVEQILLRKLIEQYEYCLQELAEIEHELTELLK
ncbi:MAG TPA: hypothetical protein PKD74_03295 [Candidatus Dependentiae bacterium]|nr:hypothetical protein [Candidatus Dependentiae bacterium]